MADTNELKKLIEKAEKVKPMGEENGKQIVSIEEQRDLALLEHMTGSSKLGTVKFNPDGSVAGVPSSNVAINPDIYYRNRYKKVKDSLFVVVDYRALQDFSRGVIYTKAIPAFVIKRNEDKKLCLEKVVTVSDTEFLADYTHILNREAMAQILPLIDAGVGVTSDDLGI